MTRIRRLATLGIAALVALSLFAAPASAKKKQHAESFSYVAQIDCGDGPRQVGSSDDLWAPLVDLETGEKLRADRLEGVRRGVLGRRDQRQAQQARRDLRLRRRRGDGHRDAQEGPQAISLPRRGRALHPGAPRRLGRAAGAAARLHRHVAHVGARAARARAPARRARADARRATPAGRRSAAGRADGAVLDAVERAMDEAGFATAHVAGNSLGGYLALAARRARPRALGRRARARRRLGGGRRLLPGDARPLRHDAAGCSSAGAARGGDRRHAGRPPARGRAHGRALGAHPARAARAPDGAASPLLRIDRAQRRTPAATAGRWTPSG